MSPAGRVVLAAWAALLPALAQATRDWRALWDFNQPGQTELRLREALAHARGDDALVLRTQIARTHSLRRHFDEAHRELDAIAPAVAAAGPQVRVLAWLERGRTFRSAGNAAMAAPLFERAAALAQQQALEREFDALGAPDPHVFDELALLHRARGDDASAARYDERRRTAAATAP